MLEIGSRPLADFDRPVDMLEDCHRRVERFLDSLVRVGEEAPKHLDGQWQALLLTALDYFDGAAPLHTQDEEESLFPRMRERRDVPEVAAALDAVARLEEDHALAQPIHDRIEATGRDWLRDGSIDDGRRQRFREDARTLRELYREHIKVEDQHVFVVARAALDAVELAAIGREMQARRGGSCRERREGMPADAR